MDRTSRIGVFVCAILLFVLFATTPAPKKPQPAPGPTSDSTPAVGPGPSPASPAPVSPTTQAINTTLANAPVAPSPEKLTLLENDAIKLTLSSLGAGIREVELKHHKEGNSGFVVLNEQSHTNIMTLDGWAGTAATSFDVKETPGGATYSTVLPNGVKWERIYALGSGYVIQMNDSLTNPGSSDITLPAYSLSVGRAQPLRVAGHYQRFSNQYLGSGWLANHFRLTTINDFSPGMIPLIGIKTHDEKSELSSRTYDDAPLHWLGVENQFFTVLLTPAKDNSIDHGEFHCYNQWDADGNLLPNPDTEPDIEAAAFFPALTVPAGQSVVVNYGVYVGPKEYARLNALGAQQGELMNYGVFSLLIVPMLRVLHFWHSHLGSYGYAIILLTLMIKMITWPLQSFANRSGKRMQALQPKLKELQARHKEQPEKFTAEKLQTETFALYKDYGVNPFGGCLPALIQMPVFFSLYFMLQNAVELRGQSFFWINDLTQPDTVWSYTLPFVLPLLNTSHLMLNPLPIMVTGLTMVMMSMTPQIGDPTQAKVAKFMPLIFLFIFYNFAAGLSLYYVINNCVSVIQIYRNLRKPLPELVRKPRK